MRKFRIFIFLLLCFLFIPLVIACKRNDDKSIKSGETSQLDEKHTIEFHRCSENSIISVISNKPNSYFDGYNRTISAKFDNFDDFDYFLLCSDEYNILPLVEERTDLREIPLPPESTVRLFRKVEGD